MDITPNKNIRFHSFSMAIKKVGNSYDLLSHGSTHNNTNLKLSRNEAARISFSPEANALAEMLISNPQDAPTSIKIQEIKEFSLPKTQPVNKLEK